MRKFTKLYFALLIDFDLLLRNDSLYLKKNFFFLMFLYYYLCSFLNHQLLILLVSLFLFSFEDDNMTKS